MSFVGFLGITLSLAALPFSSVRLTNGRLILFLLLFVTHIGTTITYYSYAQNNPADTTLYYFDDINMRYQNFQFGTIFTVKLVQLLKDLIGGTYFDYFLIFQSAGFWGIATLMRIFDEIRIETHSSQPVLYAALLFAPGIHFWTSCIGKDSFLFFAAALSIWALMRFRQRFLIFVAAIAIMVLFRPHIALIAVVALTMATFFDRRFGILTKGGLLLFGLAGAAIVASTVEDTFQVTVTNAESVSEYLASKNETFETIRGNTAVHGASYPVRLISLLFRPFFFDAGGIFATIASAENLVFLIVLSVVLLMRRRRGGLEKIEFALKFAAGFGILTAITLALVYYNVGLGLRQKTMIMPAVLVLFVARTSARRLRRAASSDQPQIQTQRQVEALS